MKLDYVIKEKLSAYLRRTFSKYHYNKRKVNLIYYTGKNFGDALSPDIVKFMLSRKGLSIDSNTLKKYCFLSAVGSILRKLPFAKKTIWGSGSFEEDIYNKYNKKYTSLNVRCLRGPLTEEKLIKEGVLKNKVGIYGDPGILTPLLYNPEHKKIYEVSIIPHMLDNIDGGNFHIINPKTRDWRSVVDQIVSSKLIISSSLHGIILAEAYGVPAIWLNNEKSSQKPFKYLDYYYSTGRMNPLCVSSIQEGLKIKNVTIPDLSNIQDNLINSFPYDLWRQI